MKKLFISLLLSLVIIPINAFAYSNYIVAGGENIGISINSKGILVIGKYKVNGKNINNNLKMVILLLKLIIKKLIVLMK